MHKIKIAYLIDSLKRAGAQKILFDLCKHIDKQKFDVSVIFWRKGGFYKELRKLKGLRLIQLRNKPHKISSPFWMKIPIFLKQQKELRSIIAKEQFDIVHSHLLFPNIHNSLLKRKFRNVIAISTKHNTGFSNQKIYAWLGTFIDSRLDYLTTVSDSVQKLFKKFNPNIKTIYNGVNLKEIIATRNRDYPFINKHDFNIISVGRLTEQKGFDHLIKTFKLFDQGEHHSKLFICGEGEKRKELEHLIKKFRLENKVVLLGERDDIYSLLKACDMFVLLSNWEGFGIVLLEAMVCRLPVIGSDIDGIKEIIEQGKNGYLVNRFGYDKVADLMIKIKNDSKIRKVLAEEGLKTVKDKFDIQKSVEEYEDLYLKLVGG